MSTRFIIVTLILLGILSSADARRHHHAVHTDRHRIFDPPRVVAVVDHASVFDTGTGRTEWLELSPLELMMLEPPPRTRVVWLDKTETIVVGPDYLRMGGWASLIAGLILLSYIGGWMYHGADKPMVLVRCHKGSPRWWNVLRLRCKQAKEFAIESYRSHTIGTVREQSSRDAAPLLRRRELTPEEKWDLHHISLF